LAIDGEPKGLLAMLPTKPLTLDELKVVPADATMAWVARLDAAGTYQKIRDLVKALDPGNTDFDQGVASFEQMTGLSLADDLLKPLGDSWAVYSSPGEGSSIWMGATVAVTIADGAKLAQTHDRLLQIAGQMLEAQGSSIKELTVGT
jgi:hypothetical protein